MHAESLKLMAKLLRKYAPSMAGKTVVDVGSHEYHGEGSYRQLVESQDAKYTGIDMQAGGNVDIVVEDGNNWLPLVGQADIVISGQCLEHVRWPWEWSRQVASITKPRGLIVIIAPWEWRIHRYPVDCWRILPDGMAALHEWMGVETLGTNVQGKDCWGVARKP